MRFSHKGETVGITLRLPKAVFQRYGGIAARANLLALQNNKTGAVTAQDVMRERLASLPATEGGADGSVQIDGRLLIGLKKGAV